MWFSERLLGESCESRFQKRTRRYRCQIYAGKKKLSVRFGKLWMNDAWRLPEFSETKWYKGKCKDMVPQGLCLIKEYILISAYCGGKKDAKHTSVIYVMNWKGKLLQIWELPFRAHVGGMAYDGRNLWVCSGGNDISAFDFVQCLEIMKQHERQEIVSIKAAFRKEVRTDTTTSFCACAQNRLWTGKFVAPPNYKGEPWIYGYPLEQAGKEIMVDTGEKSKIRIASVKHVQGACFAEFQGKKYLLLSKSYGKYLASHVGIYEYSNEHEIQLGEKCWLIRVKLPPMLEQIVMRDGKLYMLFESSAEKFYRQGQVIGNCRFPVNRLCAVNFAEMMEELKRKGMIE